MSEPRAAAQPILPTARIAILGLGLMGGSLAYALHGICAALVGVDPDLKALEIAEVSGIFQELHTDPDAIEATIDVWILAAPVRSILATLVDMVSWTERSGVVIDVGSTKVQVTQAMQALPGSFDPLGGHPMCGKESGSFANAESGLFNRAPFAWCRLARTSPRALQFAEELTTALRADAFWLSPEIHDRWTAATSHLPYLLANALSSATSSEVAPLIGPGFRSTTRVAGSAPQMMLDILVTNREQILTAALHFQDKFQEIITLLEAGDIATLSERLDAGRQQHTHLLDLQGTP